MEMAFRNQEIRFFSKIVAKEEDSFVIPAQAGIQKGMKNYYVYILSSKRN